MPIPAEGTPYFTGVFWRGVLDLVGATLTVTGAATWNSNGYPLTGFFNNIPTLPYYTELATVSAFNVGTATSLAVGPPSYSNVFVSSDVQYTSNATISPGFYLGQAGTRFGLFGYLDGNPVFEGTPGSVGVATLVVIPAGWEYAGGVLQPAITWTPAIGSCGIVLGAAQLNASASVAGSFVYSPVLGTLLPPGDHTLSVTFTPTVTYSGTTSTFTYFREWRQCTGNVYDETTIGSPLGLGMSPNPAGSPFGGLSGVGLTVPSANGPINPSGTVNWWGLQRLDVKPRNEETS